MGRGGNEAAVGGVDARAGVADVLRENRDVPGDQRAEVEGNFIAFGVKNVPAVEVQVVLLGFFGVGHVLVFIDSHDVGGLAVARVERDLAGAGVERLHLNGKRERFRDVAVGVGVSRLGVGGKERVVRQHRD